MYDLFSSLYFFFFFLFFFVLFVFFFQAEDGIRDLVRSRGLGDVYKRQVLLAGLFPWSGLAVPAFFRLAPRASRSDLFVLLWLCLLYTSDAADERSSVDLGGRRIIKKKTRYTKKANDHLRAKKRR